MLKRAFFWGSLLSAIIYIIWTTCVLAILYQARPDFYQQIVLGKVEIGDIIRTLSEINTGKIVQLLFWWISCLSVITSIIGVGLGLIDVWKKQLHQTITHPISKHIIAVFATILPAYLITISVPNAFMKILGFAGMILVIIAILLPLYLLHSARIQQLIYIELNKYYLKMLCLLGGITIMICEIFNMLFN